MSNKMQFLHTLEINEIKPLNGFHNTIYSGIYKNKKIVIRESNRRSKSEVEAEVSVLNTISSTLPIAAPISIKGHYVIVENNNVYSFYNFVEGKNWFEHPFTSNTHFNLGALLGKLHLEMSNIQAKRKSFLYHPDMHDIENKTIIDEYEKISQMIRSYDKTPNNYGLIHGDFLYSNIIYSKDYSTIIDFDDMEYQFYIYDVAVYLFYFLLGGDPSNIEYEPNIDVFISFMRGYRSVNQITTIDFSQLNIFFRWRQLKLYQTINKMPKAKLGKWQTSYIDLTFNQIQNNEPFVTIDYDTIYKNKVLKVQ